MENLYYNEDVFNSYRDYVLGGFVVEKDDLIDFELIQFKVEDKIEKLILNHFQDSNLLHIENNEEYDLKDALTSIYMSFSDYFGYYPKYYNDISFLVSEIMNTPNMQKWLYETIKNRVDSVRSVANLKNRDSKIPNTKWELSKNLSLVEDCKNAFKYNSLDLYLEQLSTIEM